MKKIPNWLIIVFVISLLVASKFIFFNKKQDQITGNKNKNSLPVSVNYFVAKFGNLDNEVFTTGKIGAFNQIDVLPEVNGKVIAIYFKEGETVNKGSLLVKLNDSDLQAQLLKNNLLLKLSEQKFERVKKLLTINGISQEEYDTQENEISGIKADRAYIEAGIAKTNIVAPFTGVVGLKNISEGSFVGPTTPLVSLVQLQPLFVEFSIPEKYAAAFKKGSKVTFSTDQNIYASASNASIYAVEPKVDEITKTIKARALIEGQSALYPGSFVKVFTNLGETKDALLVPTQAVISTLKGQKVIVCKNNAAVDATVTIGVRSDTKIQIVEGIQPGDTVVTTGLLSIRPGSKLKLTGATK